MGICFFGQGDCGTSTTVDITNITNNDTSINNSIKTQINQDCDQLMSNSNTVNILGSTVKHLTATQKNEVQSSCIMQSILKNQTSTDIVNKLLDQIKNNLITNGALLGSTANNSTIAKNMTNNKTSIDNSKFNDISKKCIQNLSQSNLLNIIGSSVEDSTIDQGNASFLKCLSQHSDDTLISAASLNDTSKSNSNDNKTQGGDAAKSLGEGISTGAQGIGSGINTGAQGVGSIISSYTYPLIGAAVCCSIVILVICYLLISNPETTKQFAQTASDIHKSY